MVISSPANLRNIERYKQINRRLFDPRTIASEAEARKLVREGKLFVLVTCSMHASEVGATQMSVEAVYRLATDNSPETQKILDNVVFLLVPCLNPDGQILVTDWYNKTLGTPYEDAPLPWLYHPYVGHDNNRDAYMFTQIETRLIGKILYEEWLPEVWLDEHQMGNNGAADLRHAGHGPDQPQRRPPHLSLCRPARLRPGGGAREGRQGRDHHRGIYTYWWEGAMGWAGWWHNMIGMLTEVASVRTATSVEQEKADPQGAPARGGRRGGGERGAPGARGGDPSRPLPAPRDVQFRSQYPRPWLGGRWTLRDIVDYDFIATFGLLETAADLRGQILESVYTAGKRQVEQGRKGDPFAVVVPREQSDAPTVVKMLQTLALGGVEVHQAQEAFSADGAQYKAGDYVILMAQPFRAYAKDMLEAQDYPKIPAAPGLQPRPPYDVGRMVARHADGRDDDLRETAVRRGPEKIDEGRPASGESDRPRARVPDRPRSEQRPCRGQPASKGGL